MDVKEAEAGTIRNRHVALAGLAAFAAVALVATGAQATHVAGYPHCVNQLDAAESGFYEAGRVRFSGYAGGIVAGVPLQATDTVSPSPTPDVFDPADDGATHMQLAGGVISLDVPGLQNTFLHDGPPFTKVRERAYPIQTGSTASHTGAQSVTMVFNGEVTIHPNESFKCESVNEDGLIWRFSIPKVELDGYATAMSADDGAVEPWGVGTGIDISPGDTSDA